MNNRIDILITESPIIDAAMPTLANITEMVDGAYTWTIGAMGGFKTAQLSLRLSALNAFKMLNAYMGKRIVFLHPTAPAGGICWEGMVNTITVDDGRAPVSRSIANTYNWIKVIYSTVDYTQPIPILGQQTVTASAIDGASRALYGQRQLYFSAGGLSDANAVLLREALYNKYSQPRTLATGTNTGGGVGMSDSRITFDCVGYWETLDKQFYIDTFAYVPEPISNIVQDVIDPAGGTFPTFVSADQSGLVANSLTQSPWQDKYITTQQYLAKLCGFGHAGYFGPSFFGLYENRVPFYTPYPNATKYTMRRMDPLEIILDATTGRVVPPWLVRPAQIMSIPDLLPDGVDYADDITNVRTFVIGEVQFTSPNKVRLAPQTDDPTQVILSRFGVGN